MELYLNLRLSDIPILTRFRPPANRLGKSERQVMYNEIRNCLDDVETIDGKPFDELVGTLFFDMIQIFQFNFYSQTEDHLSRDNQPMPIQLFCRLKE